MSDDMVSAEKARELLEGSTPGPWCAGRSSSGHPCIAQTADPGEDVAVALDAIFADAALMAAAPDLAQTVVALHARLAAVEAERDAAVVERDTIRESCAQIADRVAKAWADAERIDAVKYTFEIRTAKDIARLIRAAPEVKP